MTTLSDITNGNLTLTITGLARVQGGRFRTDLTLSCVGPTEYTTYLTEPERVAWTDHQFINPYAVAGFLMAFLSERDSDRFASDPGDTPGWGYKGLEGDLWDLSHEVLVEGRDGIDYQTKWIRENWPDSEDWDIDDSEPEGLIFIDGDLCVDWSNYDAAPKGIHR